MHAELDTTCWVFPWKAYPHPALTLHPTCSSEEEDDDWCPPLPARTYLMDTYKDEVSSLPSKLEELMSSPERDAHKLTDSPRIQHFDLLVRHQESSQVSQSNPDHFTNTKALEASDLYNSSQWVDHFRGESLSKGQFEFIWMLHMLRFEARNRAASWRIYFLLSRSRK